MAKSDQAPDGHKVGPSAGASAGKDDVGSAQAKPPVTSSSPDGKSRLTPDQALELLKQGNQSFLRDNPV